MAETEREAAELALRAKEREEAARREAQAKRQAEQDALERAKKEAEDAAKRKRQAEEAERQERERQKDERNRQAQEKRLAAERDAELRAVATEVATGKLILTKKRGGSYVVAPPGGGAERAIQVDHSMDWVQRYCVVEPEPVAPKAAPQKVAIAAPATATSRAAAPKEPPAFLKSEPMEKPELPQMPAASSIKRQRNVQEIARRLRSEQDQPGALLDLLDFMLGRLTRGGVEQLRRDMDAGATRAAFFDTPAPLAEILRDTPGNIPAIMILGISTAKKEKRKKKNKNKTKK